MLKLTLRTYGVAACAALSILLTSPALAGTLYAWETEDGVHAFTDDPKKIPSRYREQAVKSQTGGLDGYERYTRNDPEATGNYERRLSERLERLRQLNAQLYPSGTNVPRASGAGQSISLRLGGEAAPELDLTSGGDEPIVIEKQRFRPEGQITTRHNTIVTQGDRTLVIMKGKVNAESNASMNVRDERELER